MTVAQSRYCTRGHAVAFFASIILVLAQEPIAHYRADARRDDGHNGFSDDLACILATLFSRLAR